MNAADTPHHRQHHRVSDARRPGVNAGPNTACGGRTTMNGRQETKRLGPFGLNRSRLFVVTETPRSLVPRP